MNKDLIKLKASSCIVVDTGASYEFAVLNEPLTKGKRTIEVTFLTPMGNARTKFIEARQESIPVETILDIVKLPKRGAEFKLSKKERLRVDQAVQIPLVSQVKERSKPQKTQKTTQKMTQRMSGRTQSAGSKFKKGKFNPLVSPVDYSDFKESKASLPIFGISLASNNKNLFRAAMHGNIRLLKALLASENKLTSLVSYWSPNVDKTPLQVAIQRGDKEFLAIYLKAIRENKVKLANPGESQLQKVVTGSISNETFGIAVRQVQMSRGGREGNNAFLQEQLSFFDLETGGLSYSFSKLVATLTPDMLEFLIAHTKGLENVIGNSVGSTVRTGNHILAAYMIRYLMTKGGFGFNQLHLEVLEGGELTPFKKVSVTKKPIGNYVIAPLHCACINPNAAHLEFLLTMTDDIEYPDQEQRKAIHYAAASVNGNTVKALIAAGSNLNAVDMRKVTALMVSATVGRVEAAKELIKGGALVNAKSKEGYMPLHLAALHGHLDMVTLLLDNSALIEAPGPNRATPLMLASQSGHYEVVETLLERGAKVIKRDKFRRTALIYAVKNGHTAVTSVLLAKGSMFDDPDSSKNSPLHYACAYGWPECIELLLQAGANVNPQNDWKLVPLLIAMLKGVPGVVKLMLQKPDIDVNCKDDSGRTLLSNAVSMLSEETLEQIEILLTQNQADPNIPDLEGKTALHHLAELKSPVYPRNYNQPDVAEEEQKAWVTGQNRLRAEACNLLIDKGSDINAIDKAGNTPLLAAIANLNFTTIDLLLEHGADLVQPGKEGQNIFHITAQFNSNFWAFVRRMLKNRNLVTECLNQHDDLGYTPLHRAVLSYISTKDTVYSGICDDIRKEMTATQTRHLSQVINPVMKPPNQSGNMIVAEDNTEHDEEEPDEYEDEGGGDAKPTIKFIQRSQKLLKTKSHPARKRPAKILEPEDSEEEFIASSRAPAKAAKATTFGFGISSVQLNVHIDEQEVTKQAQLKFDEMVSNFILFLQDFVKAGAKANAKVSKLKKYRNDPGLIMREAEDAETEEKSKPREAQMFEFHVNPTTNRKKEWFILSNTGEKLWKEYGDHGLGTVMHILASGVHISIFNYLMTLNIDINQQNFYQETALDLMIVHCASLDTVKTVLTRANPNLKNYESETSLLKAVKFGGKETIQMLVEASADPDIVSRTGHFPLKAAVQKRNLNFVDALLNAGANPNLVDLKNRSALHHAFNGAATTADASFDIEAALIEHGADINLKDKRLRTPIFYAFVKIRKAHDSVFIDPIEAISSACGVPNLDVNCKDSWGRTPLHYASQRGSVTSATFLMSRKASIDLKDNQGNTPLSLAYLYSHPNFAFMLIQKGADVQVPVFVEPIKNKPKKNKNRSDPNDYSYNIYGLQNPAAFQEKIDLPLGKFSQFTCAVKRGWQGVAYLLLFNGYNYMLAMQDAMGEGKFKLVLTLLAKVADESIVQQTNESKQNLFHSLAYYGAQADFEITTKIGQKLISRGVRLHDLDADGKSPLHYAAASHYGFLVDFLIRQGSQLNLADKDGNTPLMLAIQGKQVHNSLPLVRLLVSAGADCNIKFEDGMTPLSHAIKQEANKDTIQFFLENTQDLNSQDAQGLTALMHAVKTNNEIVVTSLLKTARVDLNKADNSGKTVLHYTVQPLEIGSFENVNLLECLITAGAKIAARDASNHTAYWYALRQKTGKMAQVLKQYGAKESGKHSRRNSGYYETESVDFITDSESYVATVQAATEEVENKLVPDSEGGFQNYYEVFEGYDATMTKVDLSHGPYSSYMFYRMQLLRDTNRGVFVIFTRWGRIGEVGAFQRTPFADEDAAKKEYGKIFKSKTSNEWGTPFQRVKGKYRLLDLNRVSVKHTDFLKPFNLHKSAPSHLPESLQTALQAITDTTIYFKKIHSFGINVSVLNFSNLPRKTLEEATILLKEISLKVALLNPEKTKVQDILALKEDISELSSRYYELIPVTTYKGIVPPIQSPDQVHQNFQLLDSLENIEAASKICLGALHRQRTINPLDYVMRAVQVNLEPLDEASSEYALLRLYIERGGGDLKQLKSISRLTRKGEPERIQKYQQEQHRKLLWHGSGITNFLGIMLNGLKIAPPEAPASGYMFGKGVYFADMFQKSSAYSMTGDGNFFLLLAEVVLGNMFLPKEPDSELKLAKEFLSVKGVGRSQPDFSQSIYMENGIEVPVGVVSDDPTGKHMLYHNEYIVYDASQVRLRYLIHMKTEKPTSIF